jgi:hypothetical protein
MSFYVRDEALLANSWTAAALYTEPDTADDSSRIMLKLSPSIALLPTANFESLAVYGLLYLTPIISDSDAAGNG